MKISELKTISPSRHVQAQKKIGPFFKKAGEKINEEPFFSKSRNTRIGGNWGDSEEPFFNYRSLQPKLTVGQPSDKNVQTEASSAFGEDFSSVTIHENSTEAKDLGALAFTQNENIHFASGEFNPHAQKGQELIGHEFAHVQQQKQGRVKPTIHTKAGSINDSSELENEADNKGKQFAQYGNLNTVQNSPSTSRMTSTNSPMQMLKKSNHPWTGTVSGTSSLALRDVPSGRTLADLPRRTLVDVKSTSGNWLGVEVDTSQSRVVLNDVARRQLSGSMLGGFSYHAYVDDAAAAEMTGMLGDEATWVGSGPGSGNTFEAWASASSESVAPVLNVVTTINCWEMVILAAYRIGAINWQWIHDLYTNTAGNWGDELPNRMTAGGTTSFDLTSKTPLPERGDLVFFNGASHVALATGNGDEILTFWPPPNTAFTAGGTIDDVKTSTIGTLSSWMTTNFGKPPAVTFGTPAW